MAKLNPFAKQKKEESIVEESIEFVEVEIAPDSSITYFNEEMNEKREAELKAKRKAQDKKRALVNILNTLDDEKNKRETKREEILQKVETLKEEQRKIARDLSLNVGTQEELEKRLNELSVAILSEQAKAEAFTEHAQLYLSEDIRTKIKKAMNDMDAAHEVYRKIKSDTSLLDEIREVIQELKRIEESLISNLGSGTNAENANKIVGPYVSYFISEEELEALFNREEKEIVRSYFTSWIKSDSGQTFAQYARYLLSL